MNINEAHFTEQRLNMVRTIESEVRYTREYLGKSALDHHVIEVMKTVPRHKFVSSDMQDYAYEDSPLYIGHGQTISQPYIVAIMTDLISPAKDHVVLDIGTGSGYQAAVLSRLVKQVYSVDIVDALAQQARNCFAALAYENIEVKTANGYQGWLEHAPYDGIVVAATAPYVPTALVQQLKPGGKLILPIGAGFGHELVLIEKNQDGTTEQTDILPVSFVPLVGDHEFDNV